MKKHFIYISIILIQSGVFLFLYFPKKKPDSVSYNNVDSVYSKKDEWEYKMSQAVKNNDSTLYNELSRFGMWAGFYKELFYPSFVMSMEYENRQATYNLGFIIDFYGKKGYKSPVMINFQKYSNAKLYEDGWDLSKYQKELISDKNGVVLSSNYFLDQMKKK
jgi:hypothetical protein